MKSSLFSIFTRISLGITLCFISGVLFAQDSLSDLDDTLSMSFPFDRASSELSAPYSSQQALVDIVENFVPMIGFVAFFYAIVTIFKTFFDYRLKTRLIDKSVSDESLPHYFLPAKPQSDLYESLKWGLVAAGLGIGLIIANYLILGLASIGVIVLFVASGFISYFIIINNRLKKEG